MVGQEELAAAKETIRKLTKGSDPLSQSDVLTALITVADRLIFVCEQQNTVLDKQDHEIYLLKNPHV